MDLASFQVLPAEQFELSDLCSSLLFAVNGKFKSRAMKQLLGPLIKVDPRMIKTTIARELQSASGDTLLNSVSDIGMAGSVISESFTSSANELWMLIQVRL